MHIEWSLLNEEGTTAGKVKVKWKFLQLGNVLPTEGYRYWDQGNKTDFMEKDPVASLLWPWGLLCLLTEGQKVLKHLKDMLSPMVGARKKHTTKHKNLINHSRKWVIPESPCMHALSIGLHFHLKIYKRPYIEMHIFYLKYSTPLPEILWYEPITYRRTRGFIDKKIKLLHLLRYLIQC